MHSLLVRHGLRGTRLLEGHRGLQPIGRLHADGRCRDHITDRHVTHLQHGQVCVNAMSVLAMEWQKPADNAGTSLLASTETASSNKVHGPALN